MRSEPKRTLRQLNAFNLQNVGSAKVNDIIFNVSKGLEDYEEYLDTAQKFILKNSLLSVAFKLEIIPKSKKSRTKSIWRYHLLLDDKLAKRKTESILNYFFKDLKEKVYTKQLTGKHYLDEENELTIDDRNEEELYLDFYSNPEFKNVIYLKTNDDSTIKKQKRALKVLKQFPEEHHTPILRLFHKPIQQQWFFEQNYDSNLAENIKFKILDNTDIDGATEQQEFVKKALASKDFALLEGPPGSGKTTAIIELIIQCVLQGQRVLLVSSTHVAVDNVIDRIIGKYQSATQGVVSPLRIGREGDIRKEAVKDFRLEKFVARTKEQMLHKLNKKQATLGINALKESLISDKKTSNFDQIILDSANLVSGTVIGILQHPGIKSGVGKPFDVMIVDEASKVTFLDFLVPALHAKKWVLVGDVKQLSPYAEDDIITEHINKLLDKDRQELITETFELHKDLKFRNKEKVVHILFTKRDKQHYLNFKDNDLEVFHLDAQKSSLLTNSGQFILNSADVIIAKPSGENEALLAQYLKFKAKFYGSELKNLSLKHFQNHCHKDKFNNNSSCSSNYAFQLDVEQNWGELVGRSLEQMYQYRFEEELEKRKKEEFDILVPSSIEKEVEGLRRVALPSILELLQIGVGKKDYNKNGEILNIEKILYSGFSKMEKVKALKFQSLKYQHRMEDDIARYSREHFYNSVNLTTANTVLKIRDNPLRDFNKSEDSVIWMPNAYRIKYNKKDKQRIVNNEEVRHIKQELLSFYTFAKARSEQTYEVAVLSFYNDQVAKLKEMLRLLTKEHKKNKFFRLGNIKITLCTVDKFQGDEADIVLLSFVKATKGAHYNSPNRLNVAITRARYKLVLFGNPERLKKGAGLPALQKMSTEIKTRLTSHKSRN